MAISDTLSDAINEIRGYLRNQPSMYASVRPELDKLLSDMDAMRAALDRPPFDDPTGPQASVTEAMSEIIGNPSRHR
jgi:hypothetical protein